MSKRHNKRNFKTDKEITSYLRNLRKRSKNYEPDDIESSDLPYVPYIPEKFKKKIIAESTREYSQKIRIFKESIKNGKCEACDKEFENKDLVIDHEHSSGKIRGILCNNCNRGLGAFFDSPELLNKAIQYLEDFKTKSDKALDYYNPLNGSRKPLEAQGCV